MKELRAFDAIRDIHQRTLASMKRGVTIADARFPDMPLVYVNTAFEHITGYSAAEVLGRNCRFLRKHTEYQPEIDTLREALRSGRECRVVLRNYRKDGTLFWNELSIAPIYNRYGTITHFLGIQSDITKRKRAEEQLQYHIMQWESIKHPLRDFAHNIPHNHPIS